MVNLSKFTFNQKILSRDVVIDYNRVNQTLSHFFPLHLPLTIFD